VRNVPALTVTVDWAAGVATVAVRGELGPVTCSQVQDRLAWVLESCPQRLVLDLEGVAGRFTGQVIRLVAAASEQLPRGCLLDVRASPAVRELLGAAKVTAPEPASGDAGAEPGFRPGDTGGRQR
jgi:hypothetical protein